MKVFNISVVGHTNTGKTSLIRALTQDQNFGIVKNEPSTTLQVSKISLTSISITFNFFDTPGFEDAFGILKQLPNNSLALSKSEEKNALLSFIDNPKNSIDYQQEIKVLKQALHSDLLLLVIDIRQPLLQKYRYEIELLLKTQQPILPILNFNNTSEYSIDWKNELKANGLHNYLEYDTIVLPQKQRLFEKIGLLFPDNEQEINEFITVLKQQDALKLDKAYDILATFIINLLTLQVELKTPYIIEAVNKAFSEKVQLIESAMLRQLLETYKFSKKDVQLINPLHTHDHEITNFLTTDNLITLSMEFTKGAAAGASVFAGVDLLSGFSTLGAATLSGALLGGTFKSLLHYKNKITNKISGIEELALTDSFIAILIIKYLFLLNSLNDRSHAAIIPIELQTNLQIPLSVSQLLQNYRYLRTNPELFDNPLEPKFIKAKNVMIQSLIELNQ